LGGLHELLTRQGGRRVFNPLELYDGLLDESPVASELEIGSGRASRSSPTAATPLAPETAFYDVEDLPRSQAEPERAPAEQATRNFAYQGTQLANAMKAIKPPQPPQLGVEAKEQKAARADWGKQNELSGGFLLPQLMTSRAEGLLSLSLTLQPVGVA